MAEDSDKDLEEFAQDLLEKEKKKEKIVQEASKDPFATPEEVTQEDLMRDVSELEEGKKQEPVTELKKTEQTLTGKSGLEVRDENVQVSVKSDNPKEQPVDVKITTNKVKQPVKKEPVIEERSVHVETPTQKPQQVPMQEPVPKEEKLSPQQPLTQPEVIPSSQQAQRTPVQEHAQPTQSQPVRVSQEKTQTPALSQPPSEPSNSEVSSTPSSPNKQSPFSKIKDFYQQRKKLILVIGSLLIGLIIIVILISLLFPGENLSLETGSAGESFNAEFTTNQNFNSVQFVFTHLDSGAVETVNAREDNGKWVVEDFTLMRSGDWTLEVKSGSNALYTQSLNLPASCSTNSDCASICCFGACATPDCELDDECGDGDSCTIDTCSNPGECGANCEHERITDYVMNDGCCPTGATFAEDSDCTNCPEGMILCDQACVTLECDSDSDCTDYDYSTNDYCENPGTCEAACYNIAGEACDEEQIICNNRCTTPTCTVDSDCDDGDSETEDVCDNPNTCDARCLNTAGPCDSNNDCSNGMLCCNNLCTSPECTNNSECNDDNVLTIDSCSNPNSCSSECVNSECSVECSSDSQCSDGRTCYNPGACTSFCAYCGEDSDCIGSSICCSGECESIICYSNADCSFGESCYNPGACGSNCAITSCEEYTDCLSGFACCDSTCTALNCGEQSWSNVEINESIMVGGNNLSNVYVTLYNSVDNSLIVRIYNSTTEFEYARHVLPYTYFNIINGFNVTVSEYNEGEDAAVISWKVYCPNNTYCKDYNSCSSECVECLEDSQCTNGACCDNTCTIPDCNSSLNNRVSKSGLITSEFYNNYIYFADSAGVYYYTGLMQSTGENSDVVELSASSTELYSISRNKGYLKKLNGNNWDFLALINDSVNSMHAEDDKVYIGLNNGSVFSYHTSITNLGSGLGTNVSELNYYDNKVIAGLLNGELYAYETGSWVLKNSFEASVESSAIQGSTFYVGLSNGKVWSSSNLNDWSGEFLNEESKVNYLNSVSGELFAGLSNGGFYYYSGGNWYELEKASNSVCGVYEYASSIHLVDSTSGVSKFETTGCSNTYCVNEGTCDSTCLS